VASIFDEESFAFVRQPSSQGGQWIIGYGAYRWETKRPRYGFFAPDFFLQSEAPWLAFEHMETWSDDQWRAQFKQSSSSVQLVIPDSKEFFTRLEKILDSIRSGIVRKVVPVVFATAPASYFDFFTRLGHLPLVDTLYPYGFITKDEAMIGATPEVLFEQRTGLVRTMALAGTASLAAPSLLMDVKEMHEHQLVIDDIQNALSPFGKVETAVTSEKMLPSLKHLYTAIMLKAEVSFEDLVRALHPTAALGGYPRAEAWSWLKLQPEASMRRRFGAPFGFVREHEALILVAIRNIQKHSERLWLGSGCGVVAGSVPEREWEELRLKRDSVCRSLGMQ
jgi:menaquinone-specific isochorismate synthase